VVFCSNHRAVVFCSQHGAVVFCGQHGSCKLWKSTQDSELHLRAAHSGRCKGTEKSQLALAGGHFCTTWAFPELLQQRVNQ